MLRTQISLSISEKRLLDAESARTGRSIAALIRDAVDSVYGSGLSAEDEIDVITSSWGAWSSNDLDGAEWVESRRSGGRIPASAE